MPNIWPEDVKIMMIEKRVTTAKNTNEISHNYCLNYVQQTLREFQEQITRYQNELDMKQTDVDVTYWTPAITQAMENFVEQQGIKAHRLRIEGKLLLIKHEYKDRCLELAFQNENPNEYQVRVFTFLIYIPFCFFYRWEHFAILFIQLSKKWSIDKTLLDCNLGRLQKCAMMKGFYFSYPDLPFVLEFFLQMDVDVFHLKTCTFRRGQPRVFIDTHGQQSFEGIFTIDEQSIEGRYGLRPCHQNNCLCCQNQLGTIQFNPKQIHTFLNQYQAILNCPVVCSTSNIIYALTCVCGQKDYVAHTNLSFVDCLAYHRRETIRTVCEFLFGEINVELLDRIPKSEETKTNDENWLYRHSTRCSAVLELFLNNNPSYWCFVPVPMKLEIRSRIHTPSPPPQPLPAAAAAPPYTLQRQEELVQRLVDNVPKPLGYHEFTPAHVSEQKQFFKYCKDRHPITMNHVRFHQATIVAVLPVQSSALVRKFIESLFITHAECQLNRNGRLINQYFHQDYSVRGQWYRDLTDRRRPSP
ncbi:unnamed protein product [Adineta steineri]|uniref:Uncharacterized protein n=1 Tax=Adineta steineri TaxID=433720 RepID=A0A820CK27_9BILA|nr:unnamed protein product [Adineta steineri]